MRAKKMKLYRRVMALTIVVLFLGASVLPVYSATMNMPITPIINENIGKAMFPPTCPSLAGSVHLADACADSLSIRGSRVTSDFYECYFHIPVAFKEEVPIYLDIESVPSDALINYKIVNLTRPNLLVCATCKGRMNIDIKWTCYVFITHKSYSDLPSSAPFPSLEDLPDETKQFLMPTDSCQSNSNVVISKALEFKEQSDGDLITFTNLMIDWIGTFPYQGWGDAHSSILNQEATCTGCAHSAVALFRAVGVPARTLLSMPTWGMEGFDCHWIMEFYLLDYGWVRCDPIAQVIGDTPQGDMIPMACYPHNEFCLLTDYPGMDGYWFASDPVLSRYMNVNWGACHGGHLHTSFVVKDTKSETAYQLSNSVWLEFIRCIGRTTTNEQKSALDNAIQHQELAKDALSKRDIDDAITSWENALIEYQKIKIESDVTVFFDDFEGEDKGWTHGGIKDEWEHGTPLFGPQTTHSGIKCWGTDLNSTYSNNAKCWLKSPLINLSELSSATLTFWIWSLVVSKNLRSLDHTAVYISNDSGETLIPISSYMYGGYTSYQVGGWTIMTLDITRHISDIPVTIYFEFESDGEGRNTGVYIDDVHISGSISMINITPDKPQTPSGPTSGKVGTSYEYSTSATEPNGDNVRYGWDWNGNNVVDEWTDFYSSGITTTVFHTWDGKGAYQIKVKAQDISGLEGVWSDTLEVSMPRNKLTISLLTFLENHPYIFPALRYILGL